MSALREDTVRLVYDSNLYMSLVSWTGKSEGSITIWVNKKNTIFNILSIIIKCTDRISREWIIGIEESFPSFARGAIVDCLLHTRTITPAMNKYDSHQMVKLHRQINMIEDGERDFNSIHIYTIWLYIAVCCNHINDDVIDVSCSMGEKDYHIRDTETRSFEAAYCHGLIMQNNLLAHINEIRNLHQYEPPKHIRRFV
jgi:hypothetical protein